VLALALTLTAVAAACGAPPRCIAGSTQACLCSGGTGVQICDESGRFGACDCGELPPLPEGSDAGVGPSLVDASFLSTADAGSSSTPDAAPTPELLGCGEGCVCAGPDCLAELALGTAHACARTTDGRVFCWGDNATGQVGDGSAVDRTTPVQVPDLAGVVRIWALRDRSCALTRDGLVHCWGDNADGLLGDGTELDRYAPVRLTSLTDVTDVALGFRHSCAIARAGTVWCWGENGYGQLGDGSTDDRTRPTEVLAVERAVELTVGDRSTCARLDDGTARCWGHGELGQLGDGSTGRRSTRVAVAGLSDARQLVGGSEHRCALLGDGSVWCWGHNVHGMVGDGTLVNRARPTRVLGLEGVVSLTSTPAWFGQTYATLADGTLLGWGDNGGDLGDGTTTDQPAPVVIGGLGAVAELAIGGGIIHVECARLRDRTVSCWGNNTFGQVGDGSTADRRSPVVVPGLRDVIGLSASPVFVCARLADGTARCWGRNDRGQLGDGTTTHRASPVAVAWP
jgi:alpha-tubulin suppressor-like RCC1 family protein